METSEVDCYHGCGRGMHPDYCILGGVESVNLDSALTVILINMDALLACNQTPSFPHLIESQTVDPAIRNDEPLR